MTHTNKNMQPKGKVYGLEPWNQVWVSDVGVEGGHSWIHTSTALCHTLQDPLSPAHGLWLPAGKYC